MKNLYMNRLENKLIDNIYLYIYIYRNYIYIYDDNRYKYEKYMNAINLNQDYMNLIWIDYWNMKLKYKNYN